MNDERVLLRGTFPGLWAKRIMFTTLAIVAAGLGYALWHGSAVQMPGETSYSPNSQFRVEYYQVWTPRRWLPAMPGSGSDNIDGFIRLYRADGTLLKEAFRSHILSYQMFWSEDAVYGLGDGPVWELPK